MKFIFFFLFFIFFNPQIYSQCVELFFQNIQEDNVSLLSTKPHILAVKKGVQFIIQFNSSKKGISATISAIGDSLILIRPIKKDDKIMLISSSGERHAYNFIYDNKQGITKENLPKYSNVAQLDLKAMEWLSKNIISEIRFVSFNEMKMYPYSVADSIQLKEIASCFLTEIELPKVNGEKIKSSEIIFAKENSLINFIPTRESYVRIYTDNNESLKGDYFCKITNKEGVTIASLENHKITLDNPSTSPKSDDGILIKDFPVTVSLEYKIINSNDWVKASVKLYQGGTLTVVPKQE